VLDLGVLQLGAAGRQVDPGPLGGLGRVRERVGGRRGRPLAALLAGRQVGPARVIVPDGLDRPAFRQLGQPRLRGDDRGRGLLVQLGATGARRLGPRQVGRERVDPGRRGQPGQPARLAGGRLGLVVGCAGGLDEGVERRAVGGQPLAERGQRRHAVGRRGPSLRRGPRQPVELAGGDLGRVAVDGRPLAGRAGDPVVEAEVEQPDQQVLAVAGLVVQEPGELALGQRHAGDEVVVAEADELGDRLGHLVGGAGQHLVAPLEPGLLGGGAAAPRRPHDADRGVLDAVHGEVEPDAGLGQVLADDRGDGPAVVEAGHAAVEGEGQRVDHAGLAGAGRPDQGEQVDAGEVDHHRRAEDREALGFQPDRPHEADSSSSTSSSNRASTRSSTASRSARYSANRSCGVRRRRSGSAVRARSPSPSRGASTTSTASGSRSRTSSARPARAGSSRTTRR
jgi:hypothetical protein